MEVKKIVRKYPELVYGQANNPNYVGSLAKKNRQENLDIFGFEDQSDAVPGSFKSAAEMELRAVEAQLAQKLRSPNPPPQNKPFSHLDGPHSACLEFLEYLANYSFLSSVSADSERQVLEALSHIESCEITEELLQQTKIGHTMTRLANQSVSASIQNRAAKIKGSWKEQVSQRKRKSVAVEKNESSKKLCTDDRTTAFSQGSLSLSNSGSNFLGDSKSISVELPASLIGRFDNALRNSTLQKLFEVLYSMDEGVVRESARCEKIAIDLEDYLFHWSNDIEREKEKELLSSRLVTEGKKEKNDDLHWKSLRKSGEKPVGLTKHYSAKYRNIYSNLKDNTNFELRQGLYSAVITPQLLVEMEAEEMASAKIKENRMQVETAKKKLEESNLNLKITESELDANSAAMTTNETGLYACPSCGSKNTKYYQFFAKGYLSEGSMQTFASCLECQNSWKEDV